MNAKIRAAFVAISLLLSISLRAQDANPSGTLPTLYISTENNQEITSKDYYISATCYLTVPEGSEFEPLGSKENPLVLEIKGRGNYTWIGFEKKPYKLKFDKKQTPLGMNKSKHFAILAHADDELGFLRNTAGFELSRRFGMPWTPAQQPVELVLNGDYRGIYFLTENVRVDDTRVDIVEQKDNETDPAAITGGWLVEIDNYDTDPHVTVYEGNGATIWFTYKTPEVLSPAQEKYLQSEMDKLNNAIYASNKNSTLWEDYIDIDQLARYYIVQEMLDDAESFHGSCYLYKDLDDAKWKFGPVWDFGNAFRRGYMDFIYIDPPFGQTWIGEIAKFPRFQQKVREIWSKFVNEDGYDGFENYLADFVNYIQAGAIKDSLKWWFYGNADIFKDYDRFIENLHTKVSWLGEQWGARIVFGQTPEPTPRPNPEGKTIYLRGYFNGWSLDNPFDYDVAKDLYYITDISFIDAFKISDSEWGEINLGSNGEEVFIGKKYMLLQGTNDNIVPAQNFEHVDFTVDLKDPSVLITPTGTMSSPTVGDDQLTINGNTISAPGLIRVYDAQGNKIAEGEDTLTLSARGLLIVITEQTTRKLIL